METKTYSISNIHCMHCIKRIQEAVLAIEGVDFAEADLVSLSLTVDFEAPASDQIIRQTLEGIGYPATV
jgi:copper chaperone CopZ